VSKIFCFILDFWNLFKFKNMYHLNVPEWFEGAFLKWFSNRFRACLAVEPAFDQISIFFFVKIECGLYFLNSFNVLMSKIIFKKWKNIIGMYFGTKNYLKNNHYHTVKHAFSLSWSRLTRTFLLHIQKNLANITVGKAQLFLENKSFKLVHPALNTS